MDGQIIAWVFTNTVFAAVPWGIAALALLWQPPNRRNRRWRASWLVTTGVLSAALTIAAFPPFWLIWPWVLAVVGAIALDIGWWRWAHSPEGRAAIESYQFWRAFEEYRAGLHTPKA